MSQARIITPLPSPKAQAILGQGVEAIALLETSPIEAIAGQTTRREIHA